MDGERIQRQMQEVAVANYRAFIAAADALVTVRDEVSSIDKHLESMVIFPLYSFELRCGVLICHRLRFRYIIGLYANGDNLKCCFC